MILRRLWFTGTSRTPGIKYYWKQKFSVIFDTRRISYHHICVMYSHDIAEYILELVKTKWNLVTFASMDPWMFSLLCIWWRQYRIRSDIFRVLGHVIWLLDMPVSELGTSFESSTFWLERRIFISVMTYTATCFDYKLAIFRPLKLNC